YAPLTPKRKRANARRPQIRYWHFESSGALALMTSVAEAVAGVVVDHPGSLHEGVADGRSDELPDVTIERAEFLLYCEERLRVRNCSRDFQAVAHDTCVGKQRADFSLVVAGNFLGIK